MVCLVRKDYFFKGAVCIFRTGSEHIHVCNIRDINSGPEKCKEKKNPLKLQTASLNEAGFGQTRARE